MTDQREEELKRNEILTYVISIIGNEIETYLGPQATVEWYHEHGYTLEDGSSLEVEVD